MWTINIAWSQIGNVFCATLWETEEIKCWSNWSSHVVFWFWEFTLADFPSTSTMIFPLSDVEIWLSGPQSSLSVDFRTCSVVGLSLFRITKLIFVSSRRANKITDIFRELGLFARGESQRELRRRTCH
jgi:hypothetical protein